METNEQGLLSSSREMPIRDLFAGDVKQHALPARMNFRRWSHALLAFLALTAYARTALPKSKTAIDITPGPSVMSDEEKAIQADPAQRIQHGVILLEEYERNENLGTDSKYGYHMRAKILSPEARSMGDIVIPHDMNRGDLYEWWGRTILPDGSVLELEQDQLEEQIVADAGSRRYRQLKGALRGIAPGCVIDYGYIYRGTGGIILEDRITLQRAWPIRSFRLRWVPYENRTSSWRLKKTEGLAISATRETGSVLVTGSNIPPFIVEPYMPPLNEAQPSIVLYYLDPKKDVKHFWTEEGQRLETNATDFFEHDEKAIREAIEEMKIPPEADLTRKLQIAYDWVLNNIRNLSVRTREEIDADEAADQKVKKARADMFSARDVLARKEGYGMQISHLYVGIARALGAEAHVVEVPDRSDHYWDSGQLDTGQFEGRFVVVGVPGEPRSKSFIVNPGGGVPWRELAWWLTDVKGLLGTDKGAETFYVPPNDASMNRVESKVAIRFPSDEAFAFTWKLTMSGQAAHSERRRLRSMAIAERRKRLDAVCGSSETVEITDAKVAGLENLRVPLEITCEGTTELTGLSEETGIYEFGIDGPWYKGIPEFSEPKRFHEIVLEYPRTDVTVLDVTAPPGFAPKGVPPAAELGGGVCKYAYRAAPSSDGYRVERSFTLAATGIALESYEPFRRVLGHARQVDKTRLVFERTESEP